MNMTLIQTQVQETVYEFSFIFKKIRHYARTSSP